MEIRELIAQFLAYRLTHHYSKMGVDSMRRGLSIFERWCRERELLCVTELSRPIILAYQRWLFHYRKKNGSLLKLETQQTRLVHVRVFFHWLIMMNILDQNPAADIDLPKKPKRLPKVLTLEEIEQVLQQPNLGTPAGIRDRAILELMFSTGIRRSELVRLLTTDLNLQDEYLMIRQGKGGKSRLIPMGTRAVKWIEKYIREVRILWGHQRNIEFLWLTAYGKPLTAGGLSNKTTYYVRKAGFKTGACHVFRHTMATLMLEGGADIRHIQEILGHERLDTTQIYTKVSISHLKAVHTKTHPAAKLQRP